MWAGCRRTEGTEMVCKKEEERKIREKRIRKGSRKEEERGEKEGEKNGEMKGKMREGVLWLSLTA